MTISFTWIFKMGAMLGFGAGFSAGLAAGVWVKGAAKRAAGVK